MKPFFSILLLITLALMANVSLAQSDTNQDYSIALNHIAVYVYNLEKSTLFYEQALHLKQIPEPFKDGRHTWFTLGAAGQLHLIQGAEKDVPQNKNNHLCFSVKSIEDFITNLDAYKIEYTNWPGTQKAPTIRVDGVKQIYFQDPDGHWIEINNDTTIRKSRD